MPDKDSKKTELKQVLFYIQLTKESIQSELKKYLLDKNNINNDQINVLNKLDEIMLSLEKGSIDRKLIDWIRVNMPTMHSYLNNKDVIRKLIS